LKQIPIRKKTRVSKGAKLCPLGGEETARHIERQKVGKIRR
jgi:hypothetical protein